MPVDLDALARGAVTLATGLLYFGVGRVLLGRALEGGARLANRLFVTWWVALGILYLASGPLTLARAFGYQDLALTLAFVQAMLVVLCVALWGILGFLLYVYTGTTRVVVPAAAFYGAMAFGLLWLFAWMQPTGFDADGDLQYMRKLGDWSSAVIGLAFAVPIFVAAVAYGTLIFRVRERAPRYRIAMVAGAFAVQFGWSIVRSATGLSRQYPDSKALLVVNQALAILVPVMVLLAYRPPAWVARRLAPAEAGA